MADHKTATARASFKAGLGTTTSLGGFGGAVADEGDKNEEISDSDKRMDAIADMIRDACAKMDSVGTRMDAFEERAARQDARFDAIEKDRKDSEDKEDKEEDKKADSEDKDDEKKADSEDKEDKEEDKKADSEDKDDEKKADSEDGAMSDDAPISRAEAALLRSQIAKLQTRMPAIISDSDRERYASIQEQAEPAFQAFGDRAPAPLDGESPTQYKRRLVCKLQSHSPRWAETRISGIADDAVLDIVAKDVYADSLSAASAGVAVPAGRLRENVRQSGGHTIITFEGDTESWMGRMAGNSMRATGDFHRAH